MILSSARALSDSDTLPFQKSLDIVLSDRSPSTFHRVTEYDSLFIQSEELSVHLKDNYTHAVIIGVGGSSMGSRAIAEMAVTENLYFLDNVDSYEFSVVWKKVSKHLDKTAFIVVSKSGSTIEILWNYSQLETLAQDQFKKSIIQQSYFISELRSNPLADFAKAHQRPILEIPEKVGGRFSVLTPVGLVVAGLCGVNLNLLREGAQLALGEKKLISQVCSLFQKSFERNEYISLFWFYSSNYRWFGSWLQQLWAESLGKKEDRNGKPAPKFSTPFVAIGSCDQHSILQQVAHGAKDKFVCLFDFKSVQKSEFKVSRSLFKEIDFMSGRQYGELITSQSKATFEALKQNGVSCELFNVDDTEKDKSLGYLFMFFQLVVATLGEHNNINAFDQPGVVLGKEISVKMLKGQL